MPPWLFTTINVAPWAAVTIFAIFAGRKVLEKTIDMVGGLIDKRLEIKKIEAMTKADTSIVIVKSEDSEQVFVWPKPADTDASSGVDPPVKHLQAVDNLGTDTDPIRRRDPDERQHLA